MSELTQIYKLLNEILDNIGKVDTVASQGLLATVDSIGYRVGELQNHLHSPEQVYGMTSNTMARKVITPLTITGGNAVWGTELELHNGTVVEAGDVTKKMDINKFYPVTFGTTGRYTIIEFYKNVLSTAYANTTITDATDLFTKVGHTLVDGDKVMLSSIVTTTGLTTYTIYNVIAVAGNDFQVSLTNAGAAVVVGGGNGTCTVTKITQTLITETVVSKVGTTALDSSGVPLQMARQTCDSRISCRAISTAGTNTITFFLGLHTYVA
jgi:hypothetical protein